MEINPSTAILEIVQVVFNRYEGASSSSRKGNANIKS